MSQGATELIIEAGHTERDYWRDLLRYRELFYFLAWRDVLVRYKQTVIGEVWAVLRPVFTMLALLASAGAGIWLAALNVKYRDFRYVVPFIVQFGLYISPVSFSSSIVPEKWRLFYSVKPMPGVIDGFRWSISNGKTAFLQQSLLLSLVTMTIVLASSIWYFRKTERTFSDVI